MAATDACPIAIHDRGRDTGVVPTGDHRLGKFIVSQLSDYTPIHLVLR